MIFVTTGTQEPFDRLIKAIDELASSLPNERIVAQVVTSEYEVRNMEVIGFISPQRFEQLTEEADLIVGHAGMGTIISALMKNKQLIVIPRDFSLGEHRNDHQMATARKMKELAYVNVVFSIKELKEEILKNRSGEKKEGKKLGQWASRELIDSLRNFILVKK